jgi:hypothetical protein
MGHSMRFLAREQSQAKRSGGTLWRVLSLQLEDFPLIPRSSPLNLNWEQRNYRERTLLVKNFDAPMYDESPCIVT